MIHSKRKEIKRETCYKGWRSRLAVMERKGEGHSLLKMSWWYLPLGVGRARIRKGEIDSNQNVLYVCMKWSKKNLIILKKIRVMYKEVIFTLWNSLQATLASEKLTVLWNLGIYVSFYDELLSDFHLWDMMNLWYLATWMRKLLKILT